MGRDNGIFMDTTVFTDIVNNIANAASVCRPEIENIFAAEKTLGTETMKLLSKCSEEVYETSVLFSAQAGEALPFALGTLRDSMILQDKLASEAIEVNIKR